MSSAATSSRVLPAPFAARIARDSVDSTSCGLRRSSCGLHDGGGGGERGTTISVPIRGYPYPQSIGYPFLHSSPSAHFRHALNDALEHLQPFLSLRDLRIARRRQRGAEEEGTGKMREGPGINCVSRGWIRGIIQQRGATEKRSNARRTAPPLFSLRFPPPPSLPPFASRACSSVMRPCIPGIILAICPMDPRPDMSSACCRNASKSNSDCGGVRVRSKVEERVLGRVRLFERKVSV